MGGNSGSSLLSIIIVVDVLLTVGGETDTWVNISSIELVLGLLQFGSWMVGTVIGQLVAGSIEGLMSHEDVERHAVSHNVLIILEVGILLQKQQPAVESISFVLIVEVWDATGTCDKRRAALSRLSPFGELVFEVNLPLLDVGIPFGFVHLVF